MQIRLGVLLVAASVLAVACNKKAAKSSAPGADAAASPARAETLEDLERELATLHAELEGGAPELHRETEAPANAAGAEPADRCTRTCDLAEAICGLRERICELADAHEDESRYADACTRATDDCEHASEACDDCSP